MAKLLGQFEQMVLLAILQLDDRAWGLSIRKELEARTGRAVSRGALYNTLDRLYEKGILVWEVTDSTPERGGLARRRFKVTRAGIGALREARNTMLDFWDGLEGTLS